MVTASVIVAVLLVVLISLIDTMDNTTHCSKVCERSPQLLSSFSGLGDVDTKLVAVGSRKFVESHLRFFPCPPPELATTFCSDLALQTRVSLSCPETSFILELCLEQVKGDVIYHMISDCNRHLKCSRFRRLCSSDKYSIYCKRIVPQYTYARNNDKILMNNTTGLVMVESSDPVLLSAGPTNWHILWVLLVLVYILVFVPCFLNFVIKRSIIDKLRHRCQRKKHKIVKVKENCEDDEPPLIPEVSKDITAPVGTTNATFIPSRPDSMTASIGVDWDFPFIDETPAVSMVSLLIDEQNKIS